MRTRYSFAIFLVGLLLVSWIAYRRFTMEIVIQPLYANVPDVSQLSLLTIHKTRFHFSSIVTGIEWIPKKNAYLTSTKDGTVWWVDRSLDSGTAWFKVPNVQDGLRNDPGLELGFFCATLAPDWETTKVVYLSYSTKTSNGTVLRLTRARIVDGMVSDEQILIENKMPNPFHFGGHARFGPDGMLYFSIGDNSSLDATSDIAGDLLARHGLLGTILRIHVDSHRGWDGRGYEIPSDNPFTSRPGVRPEIWAWGFRNPWKFSFDSERRLFSVDVGFDSFEELNLVVKGSFYGWPFWEGIRCFDDTKCKQLAKYDPRSPVVRYGREAGIAIAGVFEHTARTPAILKGKIIFADHLPGRFWALDVQSPEWKVDYLGHFPTVVTALGAAGGGGIVAAGMDGSLYLATGGTNPLLFEASGAIR